MPKNYKSHKFTLEPCVYEEYARVQAPAPKLNYRFSLWQENKAVNVEMNAFNIKHAIKINSHFWWIIIIAIFSDLDTRAFSIAYLVLFCCVRTLNIVHFITDKIQ